MKRVFAVVIVMGLLLLGIVVWSNSGNLICDREDDGTIDWLSNDPGEDDGTIDWLNNNPGEDDGTIDWLNNNPGEDDGTIDWLHKDDGTIEWLS